MLIKHVFLAIISVRMPYEYIEGSLLSCKDIYSYEILLIIPKSGDV